MWTGLNRANRVTAGMTLTELLIAVVIAGFVIIAVGNLSTMGSRMEQGQESVEMIQDQAQLAMYHLAGRLQTAYFIRLASSTDMRIQRVRPEALGEPPDPDKLLLAASYEHERYYLNTATNQIVFQKNVHPGPPPAPERPLPGFREEVLASHVESLTLAEVMGVDPATGLPMVQRNIYEVTLTIRHPQSGERHTLGPLRVASREMVVDPPPGWEPPLP